MESNLKPKNPSFWPFAGRWTSVRCTAGDIYRAEGSRVPARHFHKSCCPESSILPRKRGFCRVFAAKLWLLATRFGAWPLLVRPSGRLLLEVSSWLFILGFRDNLVIKLLLIQISSNFLPRNSSLSWPFIFILQVFRVG